MSPKLYILSDPDLDHIEHTAVIPIGEGSETLDVRLIPYYSRVNTGYNPGYKIQEGDTVIIDGVDYSPVNGQDWQEMAKRWENIALKAIDLNERLVMMIENSNVEIKNDPRDN